MTVWGNPNKYLLLNFILEILNGFFMNVLFRGSFSVGWPHRHGWGKFPCLSVPWSEENYGSGVGSHSPFCWFGSGVLADSVFADLTTSAFFSFFKFQFQEPRRSRARRHAQPSGKAPLTTHPRLQQVSRLFVEGIWNETVNWIIYFSLNLWFYSLNWVLNFSICTFLISSTSRSTSCDLRGWRKYLKAVVVFSAAVHTLASGQPDEAARAAAGVCPRQRVANALSVLSRWLC